MRKYEPKTRYKISSSQVELLLWIMKYRFVSSDLLAECLGKDRSTVYERLSVLVDQGYVVKLYDKTYRFRQRPVIYYLAPAAIRYLKKAGYEKTQLHYKNKTFTDEQIDEQFLFGELARTVRKPYGTKFALYTKYQFGTDVFPLTPPFYAKLEGKDDTTPDYFIEYFPPLYESWKIRKRINSYVDYVDEHDEYIHPHLLLICGNHSTEKRVVRMTTDLYSDFDVFTTTKERLLSGEKKIWLRPYEVDWEEELEYHPLPLEYEE
jgi:predicted transcriptional regulator